MRVKGEGALPSITMWVGEGPGFYESKTGRPFVGPSGEELNRYLNGYALPLRSEIYLTNLFKEWAGGAPTKGKAPTQKDLELSEWELHMELQACAPQVVVTLGGFSTKWFLGKDTSMDVCHGLVYRVAYCRACCDRWVTAQPAHATVWCNCGYGMDPAQTFYVVPVVHPAAGLHQPPMAAKTASDLAQLSAFLKMGPNQREAMVWKQSDPGSYVWYDGWSLMGAGGPIQYDPDGIHPEIGLDTEGKVEDPWGFSASFSPGTGMVRKKLPTDKNLQLDPNVSWILHNYMHDKKAVEAMGGTIPEGSFHDTMVMAYLLGIEPQALKDLSERHLGRVRPTFSDLFIQHHPIVSAKTGKTLKKTKAVVLSMDDPQIDPQVVLDYAGADADDVLSLKPILWKKLEALDLTEIYEIDRRVLPLYARMEQVGIPVDLEYYKEFGQWLGDELALKTYLLEAEYPGLNPASPDQVAEIMFGHLKLPGGKKTPVKGRYSTNDKIMESLKDHPFVAAMIEWRELAKFKNTFIDPLPKYCRGEHPLARLFCELLATRVVSGRLAAKNPNTLAYPKYTNLGKRFRAGVRATKGRRLGSWDLNQIELRVLALDSGSQVLTHLLTTGKDVHNRTACKVFDLPAGTKETPAQRVAAKAVNFGIPMGLTEVGLAEQMRKHGYPFPELKDIHFASLDDRRYAEAKVCQKWIEATIDDWGIESYIKGKHAEARRFGYVRSRGGRIRFLPSVLSPNKKIREAAQRDAQAYGPQAGARFYMKQVEYRVWSEVIQPLQKEGQYIEPILDVHDDLLLEFDEGLGDLLLPVIESMVAASFDTPIPITAKGAVGEKWSEL